MSLKWNKRYRDNVEKMKSGDIFEVADIVRNLSFKQKDKDFLLTLWILGKNDAIKETQEIQAQFGAQMLSCNLNTIQLLESLNFNPLEKTLPLSKQKIGKSLKFCVFGVFVFF